MAPQPGHPLLLQDLFAAKDNELTGLLSALAIKITAEGNSLGRILGCLDKRETRTCWTCTREEMLRALNKRHPQFCFKCKQSAVRDPQVVERHLLAFVEVDGENYRLRHELFEKCPTLFESLFAYLEKSVNVRRRTSRNYPRLCPGHSFSREPFDRKQWESTWAKLPGKLKMKVLSLDEARLTDYLHIHLRRFQLCVDCAEMVRRSLDGLLYGFKEGKLVYEELRRLVEAECWYQDDEYSPLYFQPLEVQKREVSSLACASGNTCCQSAEPGDIVVKVNVRNAPMLVQKAFEAEAKFEISKTLQAETHRHATSIVQGQRELLYCIGSYIMDRTKDAWEEHVASCHTAALVLLTVLDCIGQKITHVYRETTELDFADLIVETKTEVETELVPCSVKTCSVKNCKVAAKKPVEDPLSLCSSEVLEEDPVHSLILKQYLNSPERQAFRSKLRNNFQRYCEQHGNGCFCHLKNIQ